LTYRVIAVRAQRSRVPLGKRGAALTTVSLKLISPLRPCLVVDGGDQFLLMPIRLNV
jgi:hypothetical protein